MPTRPRILVVEDEPLAADIVCRYLARAGYDTAAEADGHVALARAASFRPQLVVLDIMLPGLDGLEVLRLLRQDGGARVPIILLTARGEEGDRVRGLRLGADDYVVKPFSPTELVARVQAVLRRVLPPGADEGAPLRFGELEILPAARRVLVAGEEVALTQREFDLLLFLARHPARVFTREELMDQVWRFAYYSDTSTVTVHIRRVRAKIERDPTRPRHLETVWGVGYRFAP